MSKYVLLTLYSLSLEYSILRNIFAYEFSASIKLVDTEFQSSFVAATYALNI